METNREDINITSGGYRIGTRTDIGLQRKRNEDFLDVRQTPSGLLLLVCDGMGGPGNGDRASRLAVEAFMSGIPDKPTDAEALLRAGVERATFAILDEVRRNSEYNGMGTTLVAALIQGKSATIVNVGDSRAYHFHAGVLHRISNDHSLVFEMVANGEITEEEAETHPRRNIITRALGSSRGAEPDIFRVEMVPGDSLLLSTDGLHGMIRDSAIAESIASGGEPAAICDQLVERALAAGGDDNITIALAMLGGSGEVFKEVPTDPGRGKKRGKGRGGGLTATLLVLGLLAVIAWLFLYGPMSGGSGSPDLQTGGGDSITTGSALSDSSGWLDTSTTSSPHPTGDSVHPGDLIEW